MKINNLSMIVSMITGIITTIITIYSINKPASHLTAYVTDNIFYTPPQYNEIMSLTLDEADYNNIYDRIDSVAQNARFEEKSKFVKEIINSILTPFKPPFQNGLEEYKKYGYHINNISYDLHSENIPNIMTEYEEKFSNMGIKIKYVDVSK